MLHEFESVEDEYFRWLASTIDDAPGIRERQDLYIQLHNTVFLWSPMVPNDRNLLGHVISKRTQFDEDCWLVTQDLHRKFYNKPVTVFEVLLTISDHMAFLVNGSAVRCFRLLLANLELGSQSTKSEIDEKLVTFMERRYNNDGSGGGLFPLRGPDRNQRRVELWYQMNAYILENSIW